MYSLLYLEILYENAHRDFCWRQAAASARPSGNSGDAIRADRQSARWFRCSSKRRRRFLRGCGAGFFAPAGEAKTLRLKGKEFADGGTISPRILMFISIIRMRCILYCPLYQNVFEMERRAP